MVETPVNAAIVDYGLGNLFSIKHACQHAGMNSVVTSNPGEILSADVVVLPGVGAFGDAMDSLKTLDLVSPLKEAASSGKFLFGICLGMQLLMTESYEFGRHRGLGIVEGPVVRFDNPVGWSGKLKVPEVCWNRILQKHDGGKSGWVDSPLAGLPDGEFMYFVHSFYVKPVSTEVVLANTRYGNIEFCSSLKLGNIFATQFHPERSGPSGLKIYEGVAALVARNKETLNA